LIYVDERGETKTIAKPVQGLKFNRQLDATLRSLQPNDVITLVVEKNQAGFNEVQSITKGTAEAAPQLTTTGAAPTPQRPAVPPTGRDFESKEERQARQVYIIRQSSLERAVDLFPKKSPQELIEVAEFFVEYVQKGLPNQAAKSSLDDFPDDIPE
jgi:hypothetical protein